MYLLKLFLLGYFVFFLFYSLNKHLFLKNMSTQEHGGSIAEYKRSAFLKNCNENGIKKYQLKELSILNKHHISGLF